jgi:hypothetical protein
MGRFKQIAKQVATLPIDRQDMIAELVERAFYSDTNLQSVLTDAQAEFVRQRMTKPFGHDVASDEEVAAVFATINDQPAF